MGQHARWFLLILLWVGFGCGQESELSKLDWKPWAKYKLTKNLLIESFDGTFLASRLYQPKTEYFPGLRPAIIFANSWALNEQQYIKQAEKFAQRGYIVLTYATRGFGRSGGFASGASPDDIQDVSALLDWLEHQSDLDLERIGMVGISYGGGISLLALAQESRLRTAVALSAWADLEESLYGNETPRRLWIKILLNSGEMFGNIDPEIEAMYDNLRTQVNVDVARNWARLRSVSRLADAINKKGAPVFMANSYQDNLFPPNQARRFFEKLTVQKKWYLNRGVHASASIPGVFGLKNAIWDKVHVWLDRHLDKSFQQVYGEEDVPFVFQVGDGRESYASLPLSVGDGRNYGLNPVNQAQFYNRRFQFRSKRKGIFIESSSDSGASTGIPILGSVLDSHSPIKIKKWLPIVRRNFGALYFTNNFQNAIPMRGSAQLNFTLIPMSPSVQVVAYLYEVSWNGMGTLISHGVSSHRRLKVGTELPISLALSMNAYDISPGNQLAIVLDTYDALYDQPQLENFGFQIVHDEGSKMELLLPKP